MTIGRGSGISGLARSYVWGFGRSQWVVRHKFQVNRNYEQSPPWPLRFAGTSNLLLTSSLPGLAASSGAGAITFPATGNTTISLFLTGSAVGTELFSATTTGFLQLLSGSATGTELIAGTGNDSLALPQTTTFTGTEAFTSAGSTNVPTISGSAQGSSILPASLLSGSTVVPAFYSAGAGTQAINGSGGSSQPSISSTSTAAEVFVASGSTSVSAFRTFFGLAGVIAMSGSGGGTTVISGIEYVRVPTGGGSKSRLPRDPEFTVKAKMFERYDDESNETPEPSYKVSATLVSVNQSQKLNEFRNAMALIDDNDEIEVTFMRSASRFIFKKVS